MNSLTVSDLINGTPTSSEPDIRMEPGMDGLVNAQSADGSTTPESSHPRPPKRARYTMQTSQRHHEADADSPNAPVETSTTSFQISESSSAIDPGTQNFRATDPIATHPTSQDRQLTSDVTRPLGEGAVFFSLCESVGFEFDKKWHAIFPSAAKLGLVFSSALTDMIVKLQGKAWVRAFFGNPNACKLELFIDASDTVSIMWKLFDLDIKIQDGERVIRLSNNVIQRIHGSLELSNVSPDSARVLLGDEIADAWLTSPSRIQELSEGKIQTTNCLSLQIWPQQNCPSRVKLYLEVFRLNKIAGKLWPEIYPHLNP
jgi:hypothetical protein